MRTRKATVCTRDDGDLKLAREVLHLEAAALRTHLNVAARARRPGLAELSRPLANAATSAPPQLADLISLVAPGAIWARVRRLAHPLTAMTSATRSRHDAAAPAGRHVLVLLVLLFVLPRWRPHRAAMKASI